MSDPRGLIGHDLVRTVVARRSMRVRVRVRLRAARARACVRASVVRAGHVSKPVEPSQMLMAADGSDRGRCEVAMMRALLAFPCNVTCECV